MTIDEAVALLTDLPAKVAWLEFAILWEVDKRLREHPDLVELDAWLDEINRLY